MEETATTYIAQEGRTPWRRLWARGVDVSIYGAIISVFLTPYVLQNGGVIIFFDSVIELYLAYLVVLLLEPIMIAKFGTTIGKKIFGIRVLDANGEKLTLEASKKRTYSVFKIGMGYCIPLYDLYRQYKSYDICKEGELVWDKDISYEVEESKIVLRVIIGLVVVHAIEYLGTFLATRGL